MTLTFPEVRKGDGAGERTRGRSSPSTEPGSGKSVLRIAVRSREVTATRGVAGVEDFGWLKERHHL
jgi:hypothetical protein